MADEQYKWLNRETAERLLRGEPLEAVDASARDQAERLSQALGALSAEAAPAPGELPGEQAALAAFRKAREAAEAERTAAAHTPAAGRTPAPGTDTGLVRIAAQARTGIRAGRSRWARPARLALAAAVAVGTLGGAAMAAGTGVLPTPFDDEPSRPAASVPADTTTGQPLGSGSAPATPGEGTGTGTPDGRRGGTDDEASGTDHGKGRTTAPGSGAPSATSGTGWAGAASACRALRDGKELDAGRRRALEHLAGGPARVTTYCKVLLGTGDSASGKENGGTNGKAGGTTGGATGGGQGKDQGKGKGGDKGGDQDGDKGGDHDGGGHGHGGTGRGKGRGDHGPVGSGSGSGSRPGGGKGGGRHRDAAAPAPARASTPASTHASAPSAVAPAHPGTPAGAPASPSPSAAHTAR